MHLQRFQVKKIQNFSRVFPLDPLGFARTGCPPENNLPSYGIAKECETESYVDDTKLYLSIQPMDLENGILRVAADLNHIAEWCCSHFLLISPKKTKLIYYLV